MENGLPFATPVLNLFQRLPVEDKAGAITYVADKGLCGGVNTAVAKQVRLGLTAEEAKGNAAKAGPGNMNMNEYPAIENK
eukprot:Skav234335  [mRNA]  locus=scaffold306:295143:297312:+ [translate_table: standard]